MLYKKKILFFRRIIVKEGLKYYKPYPWRKTKNHFHALTAEIMLQRTGAEQVSVVYKDFINKYKNPEDFLNKCKTNIFKNLGLIWRHKLYKKLCRDLIKIKRIPNRKEELLVLPCVGEYVAGAYRSLHLDERDFIIDSNVLRLYGRFFGFDTNNETRRKKWFIELSELLTPKNKHKNYNYALLDFTRIICKPRPLCNQCRLNSKCSFFNMAAQDVRP